MAIFFFDTSALAKRYFIETGTAWVRSIVAPSSGHVVIVSDLTAVEFTSSLARRVREGEITGVDAVSFETDYLAHHGVEYLPIPLDADVRARARALLKTHSLRTLDALQLASAIEAMTILGEQLTFVSADLRLLTPASAEGFTTDNPLNHP
jgi:predicted nucleic acid-binding protein